MSGRTPPRPAQRPPGAQQRRGPQALHRLPWSPRRCALRRARCCPRNRGAACPRGFPPGLWARTDARRNSPPARASTPPDLAPSSAGRFPGFALRSWRSSLSRRIGLCEYPGALAVHQAHTGGRAAAGPDGRNDRYEARIRIVRGRGSAGRRSDLALLNRSTNRVSDAWHIALDGAEPLARHHDQLHGRSCDHGGRPLPALRVQRNLAEEITRTQIGHALLPAHHLGRALLDHEELETGLALRHEALPRRNIDLVG